MVKLTFHEFHVELFNLWANKFVDILQSDHRSREDRVLHVIIVFFDTIRLRKIEHHVGYNFIFILSYKCYILPLFEQGNLTKRELIPHISHSHRHGLILAT